MGTDQGALRVSRGVTQRRALTAHHRGKGAEISVLDNHA